MLVFPVSIFIDPTLKIFPINPTSTSASLIWSKLIDLKSVPIIPDLMMTLFSVIAYSFTLFTKYERMFVKSPMPSTIAATSEPDNSLSTPSWEYGMVSAMYNPALRANVITSPIIRIVVRTFRFTMPCHLIVSAPWMIFWISDMGWVRGEG